MDIRLVCTGFLSMVAFTGAFQGSALAETGNKAAIEWVKFPGGTFVPRQNEAKHERVYPKKPPAVAGVPDTRHREPTLVEVSPERPVEVASFELMKTEVTVKQYRHCVEAGSCIEPDTSADEHCNWGKPDRENHPINCVTWDQAVVFANWADARLPTEAEWEYAERGGGKSQKWPWGDESPTCDGGHTNRGVFGCGQHKHTAPVCSMPKGNTIHGLCDMAGNVQEMLADGTDIMHALEHPGVHNPPFVTQNDDSSTRVVRGKGYATPMQWMHTLRRDVMPASRCYDHTGFRLARSSP